MKKIIFLISILFLLSGLTGCGTGDGVVIRAEWENVALEFDRQMYSRVCARFNNNEIRLGEFRPTEWVSIAGNAMTDFLYKGMKEEIFSDAIGSGKRYILNGFAGTLQKEVTLSLYENFPAMAVFQVKYTNEGEEDVILEAWHNHTYEIRASGSDRPAFWSYQSGSYEERPDWVLPLEKGFRQENYLGMNASDYGGGTPVSDVWRRDAGLAVGHLEMVPKLVSLPVSLLDDDHAELGVAYQVDEIMSPGMSLITFETFVSVHQGDYFKTLADYSRFMQAKGIHFDSCPETVYEPIWCAWGFKRDFTMDQIYGALPKAKELGFKWAVLDDGWQTAEGDWYLTRDKFPKGDKDMEKLVDQIHKNGMKAKLWWAPLAVDPGTDLIKTHPDYLLLNKDSSTQDISWWDAYYLCPAYDKVVEFTKNQVKTIMGTWGFDGLKIDGQHLNMAPPCFNPEHRHARPEESVEGIPGFFKMIYETALSINPQAVVEICPCGTAYNYHTMPFMNQPVASDPTSSWQIRLKGKTFKALMGPQTAYYGDHVELSDNRDDFASTVGIGGVIGTKFTWPVGAKEGSKVNLTPEKEVQWKKWVDIYNDKMLPKGEYLGEQYDMGFDRPESHVIQKDGRLYYAFYADTYSGAVELRGLGEGQYRVRDYVNVVDFGSVSGPSARLDVEFENYLLLEAVSIPTESQ